VTTHDKDTVAGFPVQRRRLSQGSTSDAAATSGAGKLEDRPVAPGPFLGGREIGIVLSPAQIEHVVGVALDSGPSSIAALLTGLHAKQSVSRASLEKRYSSELSEARLSRSLLRGLLVLSLLIDGSERGVSDIARRLDISSSTAHRYVSTLLAFGLVEQDQFTRRYRLAAGLSAEPPQRPTRPSKPR
jgi:predicted DNA-binding transcriptional regulator